MSIRLESTILFDQPFTMGYVRNGEKERTVCSLRDYRAPTYTTIQLTLTDKHTNTLLVDTYTYTCREKGLSELQIQISPGF